MIERELTEKLQKVNNDIEQLEQEISSTDCFSKRLELIRKRNDKSVQRYTIDFKLSQLLKGLPILGYELEDKVIKYEDNPKTNKSI